MKWYLYRASIPVTFFHSAFANLTYSQYVHFSRYNMSNQSPPVRYVVATE